MQRDRMKLSFLRQINACVCLDRYEGGRVIVQRSQAVKPAAVYRNSLSVIWQSNFLTAQILPDSNN
ncbi:hypothetical protein CLI84_02620 [Porphyromonas gingivalis]|nr:hypothetical protein CLI84_02620 [Porphyromonas gingivalis]